MGIYAYMGIHAYIGKICINDMPIYVINSHISIYAYMGIYAYIWARMLI